MDTYTDTELLCQTVDLTDQEWHELISRGSVKRSQLVRSWSSNR